MELRKISQEELNRVIENHQHWLNKDREDWKEMRANLNYADLSGAYLSCVNLSGANLSHTILRNADLTYACLGNADLRNVDLKGAYLSDANLSGTDLIYADLTYACLGNVDLSGADLSGANLSCAYLRNADLSGTDLSGANLSNANLKCTNLNEVNYNHLTSFLSLQCPEEGNFIGYKKSGNKIVKLRIEEDSKRSSATSRKCRASKVTVLSITSIDGKEEFQKTENTGEYSFTYEVGKTYEIDNFDDNRWNECSTGIHFFITRDEAVKY